MREYCRGILSICCREQRNIPLSQQYRAMQFAELCPQGASRPVSADLTQKRRQVLALRYPWNPTMNSKTIECPNGHWMSACDFIRIATSPIGKSEPSQPGTGSTTYIDAHCMHRYTVHDITACIVSHTCKFVRASRHVYMCACTSIHAWRFRPCRRGIERQVYMCNMESRKYARRVQLSSNGNSLRPVPQLLQPRRVDVSTAAAAAAVLSVSARSRGRRWRGKRGNEREKNGERIAVICTRE